MLFSVHFTSEYGVRNLIDCYEEIIAGGD